MHLGIGFYVLNTVSESNDYFHAQVHVNIKERFITD